MSITHSAQSNLSQLGTINVYCQHRIFAAVPLFKTFAHIFFKDNILKTLLREQFLQSLKPLSKIKCCVYMYFSPLKPISKSSRSKITIFDTLFFLLPCFIVLLASG